MVGKAWLGAIVPGQDTVYPPEILLMVAVPNTATPAPVWSKDAEIGGFGLDTTQMR